MKQQREAHSGNATVVEVLTFELLIFDSIRSLLLQKCRTRNFFDIISLRNVSIRHSTRAVPPFCLKQMSSTVIKERSGADRRRCQWLRHRPTVRSLPRIKTNGYFNNDQIAATCEHSHPTAAHMHCSETNCVLRLPCSGSAPKY